MRNAFLLGLTGLAILLVACGPTTTQANPTILPVNPNAAKNVRDTRYCEVIPVYREWFSLKAEVFNTLGLNDCPQELWGQLTVDAIKKQTGAVSVALNGPRAWAMDEIVGRGATVEGKQVTFGGIPMVQRATLPLSFGQVASGQTPVYQEQQVDRNTTYIYLAGKPIRELISPEGKVYVMQTYDLKNVPSSSALTGLGQRLRLPAGWKYLEALDRDHRQSHEAPSIGVLLYKSADSEVVEYALARTASPALVAQYMTQLPDKALLQAKLEEFYALAHVETDSTSV